MPNAGTQTIHTGYPYPDNLMEEWVELLERTDIGEKHDIMKFVRRNNRDAFGKEKIRTMYLNYVKMTKFFKTQLEKEFISTDESSISTD